MQTDLPSLAVLDRKTAGADNLTDTCNLLSVVSFEDAFEAPFDWDAHFVCYRITDQESWPRCKKPLLPKVRAAGHEIETTMFAIDYDNPGHAEWTKELLGQWLSKLDALADDWPMAWAWTLMYTTRHGARLVYVLDEPIPVDEAEGKYRWLCNEFARLGLKVDQQVHDWTRIFRLPFVNRGGRNTWEDELFKLIQQYDNRLIPSALGSLSTGKASTYGHVSAIDEEKPSEDEVIKYLEERNETSGRIRQTEFVSEAKRRLKNRECFECIFNHASIAEEGSRDHTIVSYVGQVISLLYYVKDVTPQHIYALFFSAVVQLEPDAQTPDWTEILWSAVCRLWAKQDAIAAEERLKIEQEEEVTIDLTQQVLKGVREWCHAPELSEDDDTAMEWLHGYMVASIGNSCCVLGSNGYFDHVQVGLGQLISRIRSLGMASLIKTRQKKEDGSYVELHPSVIINRQATICVRIRAKAEIEGGFIESINQGHATLVLPAYRRRKNINPEYNEDVETWLRLFFGESYDHVERWVAWSLAFDEGPICALSIAGAPGVGKQMFVRGLADCLESPSLAGVEDLISNYQYGLMNSPFLVVNEGCPRSVQGMHPADKFRSLTAGDPITVNRRYVSPVSLESFVRIIFTANNHDLVHILTGGRDMSPHDRAGLSERLLHVDVNEDAAIWLSERGGYALTAKKGKRWVSDPSEPFGRPLIARHFMWLYENKRELRDSRFLVQGNNNNDLMFEMRTQSGSAPAVIETLIKLLEYPNKNKGMVILDNRLYCLTSQVLTYYRDQLSATSRNTLTMAQVAKVFKGISIGSNKVFILKGYEHMGRLRWWEIDCELLLSRATKDGWPCSKLQQLVSDREADATGVRGRIGDFTDGTANINPAGDCGPFEHLQGKDFVG